jgi:hypothetical protein
VIYCYFEFCEKIWAGSLATEQIDGVETVELNSLQEGTDEDEEKQRESSGNQSITTDLQDSRNEFSTTQLEGSEDVAVITNQEIGSKRRTQLNSTLDSKTKIEKENAS